MKASLIIVLAACPTCEARVGHPCDYLQRPARWRQKWSRAPGLHPKPHRERVALAEKRLPLPSFHFTELPLSTESETPT